MKNVTQVKVAGINKKIVDICTKIMLYLPPIFYFSMAVAFYLKTYDSCQIKITICQIGGTILIAVFLIKIIELWKNPFPKGSFHLLLSPTLILVWSIFSASISPLKNWFGTQDEFTRRIFYIFLFYIIVSEFRDEKSQKRLINWWLAGAFISVFYGIVQFFDRFYPPNPAVGLDPFIWRRAFGSRIFSTFGNPNFYGDFLLVVAPVILSYAVQKFSKLLILFYIMTVFCIIFTYSKAVWIGYSGGVIAFSFFAVAFLSHGRKETIRKILLGMSLAVFSAMVLGVTYFTMQRIDSVRFRTNTWLGCWEMFNRSPHPESYLYARSPLKWKSPVRKTLHPLIGTGIGSFKAVYPAYRRPEIIQLEGRSNTESDHPENEFLEVLYDEGIIGFGFFILLIMTFITAAIKRLKAIQPQQKFIIHGLIGFSSGLISQLVHNTMCVSMRFVSEGVVFWLALGMIGIFSLPQITNPKTGNINHSQKPKFMSAVQIGIVIIAIYFIKYFYGFFLADMHHNIAIFHSKRGEWDAALANYDIVIKYSPDYVMTHYFKGNVYNDRWAAGDPERCIQKYQDVIKLAPNYVQIFMQMGTVYSKMGKWAEAIESFRKYQKLDPVFERAYPSLGMAYAQIGHWKEAENTFKRYIARNNWYYYYDWLVTNNMKDYNTNVKTHILKPDVWLGLGNVYYAQKKFFSAETMYKKILKDIDPNNTEALRNLAILYERTGRQQQSQKILNRIMKNNPATIPHSQ
ncbi:MAG: tetratricopeptide repeat protein [Elusimicrobiota bacterium]